jgi:hypothetical protein
MRWRTWLAAVMLAACGGEGGRAPQDITGPEGDGGAVSERASIADGDAVFFVGNSYFDSWSRDLPVWVSAVGAAVEPPIAIRTGKFNQPGSMRLAWFLKQSGVRAALASKAYKVYVIQGDEREPVDEPEGFKQAVRDFKREIEAANGTMMLFMTWNQALGTDFYAELERTFDALRDELDLPIIPVGQIYDDCQKDPFEGYPANTSWLTHEDLHQNEIGSAVNAYATFAMLTGIDPDGVQFDAPAQTNSPELLRYLSDKTWARVEPQLSR